MLAGPALRDRLAPGIPGKKPGFLAEEVEQRAVELLGVGGVESVGRVLDKGERAARDRLM